MILKNETTGKVICSDLKICESFLDRMLGLIRSSNPRNLLFKTRFGIHTFLLRDLIDIVILNSQYKIVKIKQDLKPNNLFFWNPRYDLILELKAGTIDKYKLTKNQLVVIK